jgi:UDP-N-acetylmuramate dehydrogenase
MMEPVITDHQIQLLADYFGDRLQRDQLMSRYSVIKVGGPADFMVSPLSREELESDVRFLWEQKIPFMLFGSGSNTLISDAGIREMVLINEAKRVEFIDEEGQPPLVWSESGASIASVSRRAGQQGWSGLEWASGIPGTVGGSVVNNAGAFGSNIAETLSMAEILHPRGDNILRSEWSADQFGYDYRTSIIKSGKKSAVVLSATFQLTRSTPEAVKSKTSAIAEKRQASQPGGASLGSMFKNPPGDFAGRLIEGAGLKGARVGEVEISQQHANFFINRGEASANQVATLIAMVRDRVSEKYGVELELEIQFVGDWKRDYQ